MERVLECQECYNRFPVEDDDILDIYSYSQTTVKYKTVCPECGSTGYFYDASDLCPICGDWTGGGHCVCQDD